MPPKGAFPCGGFPVSRGLGHEGCATSAARDAGEPGYPGHGRMSNGQHGVDRAILDLRRSGPSDQFDLQEFVAEHNENSQRIQSLEAKPAITVTMGPQGDSRSGGVNGLLALERPRNFKLELAHSMSTIGISARTTTGSGSGSRTTRTARFISATIRAESTSLAVTYQPDWIVDAMG